MLISPIYSFKLLLPSSNGHLKLIFNNTNNLITLLKVILANLKNNIHFLYSVQYNDVMYSLVAFKVIHFVFSFLNLF